MNPQQTEPWITSEEYNNERLRLIREGVPDDSAEFQALRERRSARDEYLFETYGRRYMEDYPGQWIAISPEGQIFIRETVGEVVKAATETFGAGNFASRRLAEFGGYKLRS